MSVIRCDLVTKNVKMWLESMNVLLCYKIVNVREMRAKEKADVRYEERMRGEKVQ